MKIILIMTGKTKFTWLQQGMDDYISRLAHYIPLELAVTPDLRNTRNMPEGEQKIREGALVKKFIPRGSLLVLFDERGKQYGSEAFASFMQKKMNEGRDICMVIGGAYGFADELLKMADAKLSLSMMTFSHQMVRLIILEQLYRAFTIIRGEPYHHI